MLHTHTRTKYVQHVLMMQPLKPFLLLPVCACVCVSIARLCRYSLLGLCASLDMRLCLCVFMCVCTALTILHLCRLLWLCVCVCVSSCTQASMSAYTICMSQACFSTSLPFKSIILLCSTSISKHIQISVNPHLHLSA